MFVIISCFVRVCSYVFEFMISGLVGIVILIFYNLVAPSSEKLLPFVVYEQMLDVTEPILNNLSSFMQASLVEI